MRPALGELTEDAPVLRGETLLTPEAQTIGLCDGTRTFTQALAEAVLLGAEYADNENTKRAIYNVVGSK